MENQLIDDSFGGPLNDQMRGYIREIAQWSNFLAIIGFIFLGLMLLGMFAIGAMFATMGDDLGMASSYGFSGGLLILVYAIMIGLSFFPVWYLFRFATKAKLALHSGSDSGMTEAFMNLKSYFKFMGIFTIVTIGLYVLVLLFGGLGSAFFL